MHEVRTRLKRSRAALGLIRKGGGSKAKRDDRRLRDAGRLLARPRDLAVQAHTFRVLGTRLQSELPPRLLVRLSAAERQIRRALEPKEVERDLKRAARALRRLRRDLVGLGGRQRPPRDRKGRHPDLPWRPRQAGGGARAADAGSVSRLAQAGQSALLRAAHHRRRSAGADHHLDAEDRPAGGDPGAGPRPRLRQGDRRVEPALVRPRRRRRGGAGRRRPAAGRAGERGPGAGRERVRGAGA